MPYDIQWIFNKQGLLFEKIINKKILNFILFTEHPNRLFRIASQGVIGFIGLCSKLVIGNEKGNSPKIHNFMPPFSSHICNLFLEFNSIPACVLHKELTKTNLFILSEFFNKCL